jgi:hypothetical protein
MASKDASKQNVATRKGPAWKEQALSRRTELSTRFKNDLGELAAVFASHESSEAVLIRHVDHAFSSLSRLGLMRRRFFLRTDFWASVGGLLIGSSLAIPDWIGLLPEAAKNFLIANHVAPVVGSVTFASGVIILSFAWYKGTNPAPP